MQAILDYMFYFVKRENRSVFALRRTPEMFVRMSAA